MIDTILVDTCEWGGRAMVRRYTGGFVVITTTTVIHSFINSFIRLTPTHTQYHYYYRNSTTTLIRPHNHSIVPTQRESAIDIATIIRSFVSFRLVSRTGGGRGHRRIPQTLPTTLTPGRAGGGRGADGVEARPVAGGFCAGEALCGCAGVARDVAQDL